MGHRAVILRQRPDDLWEAWYSHWGALEAQLSGMSFADIQAREGSRFRTLPLGDDSKTSTYDSLATAAHEAVDYLSHEAVYVMEDGGAQAYDTIWREDSENVSEWTTTGNGALVCLENPDEWGDFSGRRYDYFDDRDGEYEEGIPEEAFEEFLASEIEAERIPEWSPYPRGEAE